MYDDVIYLSWRTNLAIYKLAGLPFFKPFSKELLNLIVFKICLCLKLLASLLKSSIDGFLILREEESLCGYIKYMSVVANTVLLWIVSRFYFCLLKPLRQPLKKFIITAVIVAYIVSNFVKYLVVLKDLLEDFHLLVAAVFTREERQSKQSLLKHASIVDKVTADCNKRLLIGRRPGVK